MTANACTATASHQRGILLIASAISSLVMLDSNVVAVALPTIAQSLAASFAEMQWVITAYVLPFAALLLAAGSFGDIVGRKRAVLLGQAIFAIASLLCGVASSALMLDLARALQGVGASLLLTAALAVINHSFQGPERARAYAFWGASLGIAITLGPIIGGVISSVFGWHWAFLVNLPICAVLIVATLRMIPESSDPAARRLDVAGIVVFSAGLFLLTWAVISGNALGWLSAAVLWRLAGGLALLAAFVAVERAQLQLGLGVSACANAGLALLAAHGAGYPAFAAGMAVAGVGAGLLNGETAKAMQATLPPERSGMASGLSATVRFSALLFGVAGLGAMLVTVTANRFSEFAASSGLAGTGATAAAKRFAAGDVDGALRAFPAAVHDAAGAALRAAFDAGFGAAAWSAAAVALAALLLVRGLTPALAAAPVGLGAAELVAPGE